MSLYFREEVIPRYRAWNRKNITYGPNGQVSLMNYVRNVNARRAIPFWFLIDHIPAAYALNKESAFTYPNSIFPLRGKIHCVIFAASLAIAVSDGQISDVDRIRLGLHLSRDTYHAYTSPIIAPGAEGYPIDEQSDGREVRAEYQYLHPQFRHLSFLRMPYATISRADRSDNTKSNETDGLYIESGSGNLEPVDFMLEFILSEVNVFKQTGTYEKGFL